MSSPDLTPILEELAAGNIDAAEAARRIDALKNQNSEPSNEQLGAEAPNYEQNTSTDNRTYTQPRSSSGGVDKVSIRAIGRKVVLIGDPSVATVSAQGPHMIRRNGSTLEVSSDGGAGPTHDAFAIFRPPWNLDDLRLPGFGKDLVLRVNPKLTVDIEVTGGVLNSTDVKWFGKVRLTAGSAEITGFKEVNDVLIQAGAATLKGRVTSGRSRVRCESGQLNIEIEDDSSVTIHGEAQLGKVSWNPTQDEADEVVLGSGAGRLDVGVVMGWAHIQIDEDNFR